LFRSPQPAERRRASGLEEKEIPMDKYHSPRFLALAEEARQRVPEIGVEELKQKLDAGGNFHLLDVREPTSRAPAISVRVCLSATSKPSSRIPTPKSFSTVAVATALPWLPRTSRG